MSLLMTKESYRKRAILRALLQLYVDHSTTTRTLDSGRSAAARRRRAGAWRSASLLPSPRRRALTGAGASRPRACDLTKKIYNLSRERLPRPSAVALPLAVSPQLVRCRGTPVCRVERGSNRLRFFLLASVLQAASLIAQSRRGIITPGAVALKQLFLASLLTQRSVCAPL